MARKIVEALENKKAEDIVLMDITGISQFTDYFIICSATSERMLQSLSQIVINTAKQGYKKIAKVGGKSFQGWITLDYGDLVVHVFAEKVRNYYQLEDLWAAGKMLLRVK
jgi:ribosome-associated protein